MELLSTGRNGRMELLQFLDENFPFQTRNGVPTRPAHPPNGQRSSARSTDYDSDGQKIKTPPRQPAPLGRIPSASAAAEVGSRLLLKSNETSVKKEREKR